MSGNTVNFSGRGSLAPGTMLDHYRLGTCLGVGGMGEVYYAVHEILQTPCAIKIIRPEIAKGSPDVAARLIREARMACRIQHDNIVGVLDASSTSSLGCPYIVMEYVDGMTVEKYLQSGPMPEADVISVALGVTEALIAAARYKVVHRDIKPANIMINSRGQVKLADLGIAKSDTALTMGVTLTQENAVLGTPNYAAPEQLRSSHTVDARADIYSLGAAMYHMLSGHRPFEGDSVFNIIAKVVCETPPTFKELGVDVSPALGELIGRMMAKDPELRPASALELKGLLQKAARGNLKFSAKGFPFFRKRRKMIFAAAAAAVLLGIGIFSRTGSDEEKAEPPEAPPSASVSAPAVPRTPHPALVILLPGGVKLEMVKIKAGSFMMGSPEDELGRDPGENRHRVTLTKDYWLGKFEVTQGQWRAVMENGPLQFGKGDNYPVSQVSWDDVKMFCGKLNDLYAKMLPPGYRFDLPTEAQWEYACRAGTTTALNNGKELTSQLESCPNLDEVGWCFGGRPGSCCPVGGKRPNAWGLYDMHGNVAEWCSDVYGPYGGEAVDPIGAAQGPHHVFRGGGLRHYAFYCRSAFRYYNTSLYRDDHIGFRLALVPIQSQNPAAELTAASASNPMKTSAAEPSRKTEFPLSVSLPGGVELAMVKIKAGSFMMGSPEDELGRSPGENRHRVTLTEDYWLGKFEVTQKQWQTVMGNNPSHFKGDDRPADEVSWGDAKKFCDKLNELYAGQLPKGYCFDLPTEAQWEYACRAGTTGALNNGKKLTSQYDDCPNLDEVGWYRKNSGRSTHPVGRKRPNAWGLYDMHGNVLEWCHFYYGGAIGSAGPARSAVRGGCWLSPGYQCRSAKRYVSFSSTVLRGFHGFRLALVPIRPQAPAAAQSAAPSPESQQKAPFPLSVGLPGGAELAMVKIKAGSFMMGSPEDELGRSSDEKLHHVTLTKDFWLGKYEVTQGQWKSVMGNDHSLFGKGDDYPVSQVSWDRAKRFCDKLNELYAGKLPRGYRFDLPTEAQWEYACRAGTTTSLNNGKNLSSENGSSPELDELGWYGANSSRSTHPVGQKRPNAWGLYDMHGNVNEWCYWSGPDSVRPAEGHAIRGGCCFSPGHFCRSARRLHTVLSGGLIQGVRGFRLALVPVQ